MGETGIIMLGRASLFSEKQIEAVHNIDNWHGIIDLYKTTLYYEKDSNFKW